MLHVVYLTETDGEVEIVAMLNRDDLNGFLEEKGLVCQDDYAVFDGELLKNFNAPLPASLKKLGLKEESR